MPAGGEPPETPVIVIDPVFMLAPTHLAGVIFLPVAVIGVAIISPLTEVLQPFASVTVQEYEPEGRLIILFVTNPVFQR